MLYELLIESLGKYSPAQDPNSAAVYAEVQRQKRPHADPGV